MCLNDLQRRKYDKENVDLDYLNAVLRNVLDDYQVQSNQFLDTE